MKKVVFARIPSDEAGLVIRGLMDRGVVDLHVAQSHDTNDIADHADHAAEVNARRMSCCRIELRGIGFECRGKAVHRPLKTRQIMFFPRSTVHQQMLDFRTD